MAGVANGRAKWEAKMQNADAKYQGAKGRMAANYAAGTAEAGAPAGPQTQAAYAAGIARATLANVAGKGAKWEQRYREGMSR